MHRSSFPCFFTPKHCSRRCDGCQHRSPGSAQDRTHPRWSGPRDPWSRQSPGQVRVRPCFVRAALLCLHGSPVSWLLIAASVMIFWLPLLKKYEEDCHRYPRCLRSVTSSKSVNVQRLGGCLACENASRLGWVTGSLSLCRRQAHLCVLAANCDEPMYVKLVEALCAEHQINLIKVSLVSLSCVWDMGWI